MCSGRSKPQVAHADQIVDGCREGKEAVDLFLAGVLDQVLDARHRVVLADRGRGLVQVVAAGIADAGMDALDFGFRLRPVLAELLLTAHGLLSASEPLFVLLETVERREKRAIRDIPGIGKAKGVHRDRGPSYGGPCSHYAFDTSQILGVSGSWIYKREECHPNSPDIPGAEEEFYRAEFLGSRLLRLYSW